MFNWFKKNKFHNVSLDKFHYLGYSKISIEDTNNIIISNAQIHGFIHKKNNSRKFIIDCNSYYLSMFEQHRWIKKIAEQWLINELEIYHIAHDVQSKYLIDIMYENNYVWSKEKKWWINNNNNDNVIEFNNIVKFRG